jgi:hypothetical protein
VRLSAILCWKGGLEDAVGSRGLRMGGGCGWEQGVADGWRMGMSGGLG